MCGTRACCGNTSRDGGEGPRRHEFVDTMIGYPGSTNWTSSGFHFLTLTWGVCSGRVLAWLGTVVLCSCVVSGDEGTGDNRAGKIGE